MMPTTIVNAKPRSTSPPKKNSASARQQRRAGGDDRAAEGLVDRLVDDVVQRIAPHRAQVLAHAIEDDDRVVRGIARDRQDRRDDVQAHVVPEERQERERDEQIVDRRDDRADAKADLEAHADINRGCRPATGPSPRCPCAVSSSPTIGPTISLPTIVKLPRPACFSAASICSRALLERSARLRAHQRHAHHAPGAAPGRHIPARRVCRPGTALQRAADLLDADRLLELRDRRPCRRRTRRRAECPWSIMTATPARMTPTTAPMRLPAPPQKVVVRVLENMHKA